jgi:FRG domain-containing protein
MPEKNQLTIYQAATIAAYVEIVEACTKEWFKTETTWGPWFRGQSDASWGLQPGMYRHLPLKRDVRTLEDEIRQEFVVRAPSLGPERPNNSWEWYFLMQHSGAPTRLLDWTESALIALYFAVKGARKGKDAAVWILEPWKLNEYVADIAEVIAPGAEEGIVKEHAARYKPWLPERYAESESLKPQLPVAIYPTHFSRRISSQRSCFTIHGSDKDGFDHLPDKFRSYLRKVIIPADASHDVETSLSVVGVDELTIFPDLDGLGRWLSAVLRDESAKLT